jgi:GSCFA family.
MESRWQTSVAVPDLAERIDYQSKILFLGSCFAAEMGQRMSQLGFSALVNPFGVLYNPASLAGALRRLSSGQAFVPEDLVCSQGRYASFEHQYLLGKPEPEAFLEQANTALAQSASFLSEATHIVLSLGTSWVYRHLERRQIVANCHKLPEKAFERLFLSPQESLDLLSPWMEAFPQVQWVLTVSPIRHLKDGAHGNQLSKAALLLAIEALCKRFPSAYYFPAYELVLDELRDYRYYAADMVHIQPAAVNYIWERFARAAVAEACGPGMEEAVRRIKREGHQQKMY